MNNREAAARSVGRVLDYNQSKSEQLQPLIKLTLQSVTPRGGTSLGLGSNARARMLAPMSYKLRDYQHNLIEPEI